MKQNISIVRGRTETLNIIVADINGNPYTLKDGEKLVFGVKKNYFDTDYICKKCLSSANATDTAGVYALTIIPTDTESVSCGQYCYDVGLKSGDDFFTVIECSSIKVLHNVTCKEAAE